MKIRSIWHRPRAIAAMGPTEHEVWMDAAKPHGGEGAGNSPTELLLMALSGCMGISIMSILDKMKQPVRSLQMELTGHQEEEWPKHFISYELSVYVEGECSAKRIWRAMKLAAEKYCPVSHSLSGSLQMKLYLNGREERANSKVND